MTSDLINKWWTQAISSPTQVCYKIGFIESNKEIYWSSDELRKYWARQWVEPNIFPFPICVLDKKQNLIISLLCSKNLVSYITTFSIISIKLNDEEKEHVYMQWNQRTPETTKIQRIPSKNNFACFIFYFFLQHNFDYNHPIIERSLWEYLTPF